jgi:NAD(P)-dependent dehydrogenase (short-subunit alcohol dehydrogenase family)
MKQKIAVVTGANKGIGFEICRQLAGKGFQVFLAARDLKRGTEAVGKLKASGLEVKVLQLDVSDLKSIEKAAAELASSVDHLDVLVNNAGIYEDEDASALNISPEIVEQTFRTNTLGPLLMTQRLWPLLAKSGSGRIINVSSGLGSLSEMETTAPAYSISKAALNAVTRQCAAALKDKKIAVNSISPGWVRTEMGGAGAPLTPAEGADTVIWLATEAPLSLTSQFLRERKPIPW